MVKLLETTQRDIEITTGSTGKLIMPRDIVRPFLINDQSFDGASSRY